MSPSASDSQQVLTLQNIGEIDRGRVAAAVNNAIKTATADVIDRPADKTARKVSLTIEMKPNLDKETGVLDTVDNEFVVKVQIPVRRSAPYPMVAKQDGTQVFQPDSPFDPRQSSFAWAKQQQEADEERIDYETGEVLTDDQDDAGDESPM